MEEKQTDYMEEATMLNTKTFTTRKETTAFVKEFEKNGVSINYRITANYPLMLVGRKVKTDRSQLPINYTLTWTA